MVESEGAPHGRWYYGWNIVAACILAQVAGHALTTSTFSLFLRGWSLQLHTSISALQLGFSAFGLVSALLSPVVGVYSGRYSARAIFSIGLLAAAVCCVAVSYATAVWQIQLLYALLLPVAVGCSALVPANAVVSRWFVRRLGLALGITALGQGLGGMFLPPLVAWLLSFADWRTIWRLGGIVIGVVVTPLVVGILRDRPSEHDGLHYLSGNAQGVVHLHGGHAGGSEVTWRQVLSRKNFWLLLAIYLPLLANFVCYTLNLAPIAAAHHFGPRISGKLMSALAVSQVISTLLGGVLSDRFGNRWPLIVMALATAVGGIVVVTGQSLLVIALGIFVVGFSGGFWPLVAAAAVGEFGTRGFGTAFGLLTLFLPVAVLTPPIVSKIQEITGAYTPGLLGLAALAFLGAVAGLMMREQREGHAKLA